MSSCVIRSMMTDAGWSMIPSSIQKSMSCFCSSSSCSGCVILGFPERFAEVVINGFHSLVTISWKGWSIKRIPIIEALLMSEKSISWLISWRNGTKRVNHLHGNCCFRWFRCSTKVVSTEKWFITRSKLGAMIERAFSGGRCFIRCIFSTTSGVTRPHSP